MTRYIDADKLKEDILEENSWYLYNEFGSTTQFHELIDKQPTADVVEVVRCRECEHLYKAIGSILVNGEKETFTYDGLCRATYPNVTVRDFDHYCSYGKRRE